MRQPLVDATGRAIGPAPFPPHPLKGIRRVFGTRGLPSIRHGSDGDIATDPTTGKVYVRSASGWAFKGQGFQRLFQPDSVPEFSIILGDPVDLGGHSFALSIDSASSSGTALSWTWPQTLLFAPNGVTNPAIIYLQSSTSLLTHPLGGTEVANVISPVDPDQITGNGPTDGNWTTLQKWTVNATGWAELAATAVSAYTDSSVPDHIFNYRLILFCKSGAGNAYGEIDWNLVTSTKHYNVTVNQQPDGAHISWS